MNKLTLVLFVAVAAFGTSGNSAVSSKLFLEFLIYLIRGTFYWKLWIFSEACQSATPVHCEWNGWNVGQCSVSCGYGTRHNTRTKRVHEKDGGSCSGSSSETVSCFERECPGTYITNSSQTASQILKVIIISDLCRPMSFFT